MQSIKGAENEKEYFNRVPFLGVVFNNPNGQYSGSRSPARAN
jgi:hypothetical protein